LSVPPAARAAAWKASTSSVEPTPKADVGAADRLAAAGVSPEVGLRLLLGLAAEAGGALER
jgi:hypothetical protein